MLRVDPGQKKAVAALLVVLVAAVIAIILRVMPSQQPAQAAAQAAAPDSSAEAVSVKAVTLTNWKRNPFKRPACVADATKQSRPLAWESGPMQRARVTLWQNSAPLPDAGQIAPMPVPAPVGVSKDAGPSADTRPKEDTRPSFKLLATVKGPGGYSGVLDDGRSGPRVVEVGDVVDGRFKVGRLQEGMAVLTDGRYIIIAKRPRS